MLKLFQAALRVKIKIQKLNLHIVLMLEKDIE